MAWLFSTAFDGSVIKTVDSTELAYLGCMLPIFCFSHLVKCWLVLACLGSFSPAMSIELLRRCQRTFDRHLRAQAKSTQKYILPEENLGKLLQGSITEEFSRAWQNEYEANIGVRTKRLDSCCNLTVCRYYLRHVTVHEQQWNAP